MESENNPVRISNIKNRIFTLSPIVSKGLDRECIKTDFISLSDEKILLGSFGMSLKVYHKITKVHYIVKVLHKDRIINTSSTEVINNFLKTMYKIKHCNILRLYNHFEDEENLYLIFPSINFETLYETMRARLDKDTALLYIKQIIQGVEYLHNMKIFIKEFKPENILIDIDSDKIYLTDYGWSGLYQKEESRKTITLSSYIAPEMLRKGAKVDYRVDIWSIGVLMFELLTGKSLIVFKTEEELRNSIANLKFSWPEGFEEIPKHLIIKILKVSPEERLSIKDILGNVLFLEIGNDFEFSEESFKKESIINFKMSTRIATRPLSQNNINNRITPETNINTYSESISNEERLRRELNDKQKENDELRRENVNLQDKYKHLESEFQALRSQREEKNNISAEDSFFAQYPSQDEKIKLEFLKQDRLTVITQLEEKNSEVLEYRSNIRILENDLELLKMNLKESQEKNSEQENEILNLQNRLELEKLEKETKVDFLNQKLENIERKLLTPLKADDLNYTYTMLLADLIKDFKNLVETLLVKSKDNQDKLLHDIKELLSHRETTIKDVLAKTKESIENNYLRKSSGHDFSQRNTVKDKIEWLQKQIQELLPYKLRSTKVEEVTARWEREFKIVAEKLRLAEMELVNLRKINDMNKNEKMKLNQRIISIENKLSDIKDFMIKNCDEEKIEGFMDIYNKYNF
jgi:serine/threonine protein kinase